MTSTKVMAFFFSILRVALVAWVLTGGAAVAEESGAVDVLAAAERELQAGQPEVAADLLRKAMQTFATDGKDANALGAVALHLSRIDQLGGNLEAAERPLLQAIPNLTEAGGPARANLAQLYIELGNLTLARGALNRAQIALLKGVGLARAAVAADDPMLLEAEISLATAEIRAFRLEAADRHAVSRVMEAGEALAKGGESPLLTGLTDWMPHDTDGVMEPLWPWLMARVLPPQDVRRRPSSIRSHRSAATTGSPRVASSRPAPA